MSVAIDAAQARDVLGPTRTTSTSLISFIVIVTALRFATAAYLPLSFDEAYFWLWSRKLAISYFEHPPLIAFAIRGGTLLFGDTSFGVRLFPLLASVIASWAVWRSAARLCDAATGWTACAFFNATLMVASQGMAATPDVFVMAACGLLLVSIIELQRTRDGRWWLAAALSLGLALLAKYTAFFLGLSICAWLAVSAEGRSWLRSPWPYAAAILVFAFATPNLIWNEAHGWISFQYQFGRIVTGAPSARYFLEFVGAQIALCSPGILALASVGFFKHSRNAFKDSPSAILVLLICPALLYFLLHSLHDRVQGNWPSFVYPAVAILASETYAQIDTGRWMDRLRRASLPIAAIILAFSYLQTWAAPLPLGISDPIARMTAVGFAPVAREIADRASADKASALLTTRYVNTGWLAFYVRPHLPILQAAEEFRWTDAPAATKSVLARSILYVTQNPRRELQFVTPLFAKIEFERCIPRIWRTVVVDSFCVYRLEGFRGPQAAARIPEAYTPS